MARGAMQNNWMIPIPTIHQPIAVWPSKSLLAPITMWPNVIAAMMQAIVKMIAINIIVEILLLFYTDAYIEIFRKVK